MPFNDGFTMTRIGTLLLFFVGCSRIPPTESLDSANSQREQRLVEFRMCRTQTATELGHWEHAVVQFVAAAVKFSVAFEEARVRFASCAHPPTTCYASSEDAVVYCNAAMLERLAKSAAALAVMYT